MKRAVPMVMSAALVVSNFQMVTFAAEDAVLLIEEEEDAEAAVGQDQAAGDESAVVDVELVYDEAGGEEAEESTEAASLEEGASEESENDFTADDIIAEIVEVTDEEAEALSLLAASEGEESGYVYGTVDLPYADFYYGELNEVTVSDELKLTVADPVSAAGYRAEGMYDAVSSATNAKSSRFGAVTVAEGGYGIEGIRDVSIAVPKALYAAAQKALEDGESCSNRVLELVGSMAVSEDQTAPAEYKILSGDGTLSAMVTETVVDNAAEASITTASKYGNYQITVNSSLLPGTEDILGVIVEADGQKYGMKHLENLWFQTGQIAFAVRDGVVTHGNAVSYARHAALQGKAITKITYLVKNAADVVIYTNLQCRMLLGDGQGITVNEPEEGFLFSDGVLVPVTINAPEGSSYQLTQVSFAGRQLTAGTDYSYDAASGTLTVYETENTGVGQYTLSYTDAVYEDVTASFVLKSGFADGSVKIKDNKLVLPKGISLEAYRNSISGVSVNGTAVRGSGLGALIFAEDGSVNFDAATVSHGQTSYVFANDGVSYELSVTSNGYPDVAGTVTKPETYVYGTVDLSYADFYYGELNDVAENKVMDLDAADPVTAAGYRDAGMYDAVSSATSSKSTKFGTTYYTAHDNGVEIEGIQAVAIKVPASLYQAATAAIEEGRSCNNSLLNIIGRMTVTEEIPAEYKLLNGDGTLGAMVTATVVDDAASASIATGSVWGNYQISIKSDLIPATDSLLGAVIETAEGAKYGLEHLENLWLKSGELAFAVQAFTEPHGNTPDYARFANLPGQTITKITYLVKDGADVIIHTNLKCKQLLSATYGAAGTDAVYGEGVTVAMTVVAPQDSAYVLADVTFGGKSLTEGSDYTYENSILTVYKTDNTGIGRYTLTYVDDTYEDMTASVILTAGYADGSVTAENNRLVLPAGLDVATYLNSISAVSVNGKAISGNNLGTAIFAADGTVNFAAEITNRGNTTVVFPEEAEYTLVITSIGYPSATITVSNKKVKPEEPIETETPGTETPGTETPDTEKPAETEPPVTPSLTLSAKKAVIYTKGTKTVTLKAVQQGISGTVKWSSSNTKVATVNSKGVVTAKKTGTVTITAKCGSYKATCKVTVKKPSLTLSKKKATIYTKGAKTVTLTASKNGVSGTVKWSSSNKKIATVNSKGVVTAKKAGTVTITAKCGSYKATCRITVKKPSLTLKKTSFTVKKGKTVKIAATAKPAKTITYKSSNTKVATVTSAGVIKGIKKGKATITVKCNGVTKKVKVTVK